MKPFFSFLLLCITLTNPLQGNSPKFAIGFQSGFRTYGMGDLKSLNQSVQKTIPFDTRVVSGFPPYLYFRPMISLHRESFSLGVLASFQSTGSRVSAKDYSAEYRFDIRIHSFQYGIQADRRIHEAGRLSFLISASSGLTFSRLVMEEYLRVDESLWISEKAPFKSQNWFFEGGLAAKYKLTGAFSLSAILAYQLSFGKNAFQHTEHEVTLKNPRTYDPVRPGWNGFILGITAGFIPGNLKRT
jgi:hypothetical protein